MDEIENYVYQAKRRRIKDLIKKLEKSHKNKYKKLNEWVVDGIKEEIIKLEKEIKI